MSLRIGLVAGESSGDMLGEGLMKAIREQYPDAEFSGIGGPRMEALGFQSLADMERLSVMGFVEPLGRLPELLSLIKRLTRHFIEWRADVVVGIDSPGFNLRLESRLHDAGLRTVHYVSPSVWAWGKGRVRKMRDSVDLVLALLPFETAVYEEHGIDVRFVGHPLADQIPPRVGHDPDRRAAARKRFGVHTGASVVALMPGSRHGEVARLAPDLVAAWRSARRERPDLEAIIPCASPARQQQIETLLAGLHGVDESIRRCIHVVDGQSQEAMLAADVVMLASGTATLEAMLLGRPMVVAYRLARPTWWLASRLVTVPHVSLPNLLAGEELVPELLQDRVTPAALKESLLHWLDDRESAERVVRRFDALHSLLRRDADRQAARAVLALAGEH